MEDLPVTRRGATLTKARQDRLLGILVRDGQWATAATLADALGVTPRSVRSYVTAVNARVRGGTAIESGPQGYRAGPDAVAAQRAGAGADSGTPRDRLHRLVRLLLDDPDGVDVFQTADDLHVSPATLEADLARVRSLLGGTELTLERSASAARLRGTEMAQRRLLSRLAHDEMEAGAFDLEALRRTLGDESVGARAFGPFKDDLVGELGSLGYYVNEFGIADVVMHIAIAADRVAQDRGLDAIAHDAQESHEAGSTLRPSCSPASWRRVRRRRRCAAAWTPRWSGRSARSSSGPPRSSSSTSRTTTSSSAWRCTCRTCGRGRKSRRGHAIRSPDRSSRPTR